MKLLRKEDYTVGWICALWNPEWKASRLLLDEVHEDLRLGPGVKNQYVYGSMNGHNVVMGCLPLAQMGRGAAASVASEMGAIFPFLRFGLLVGIGGGVPSEVKDIRLGDVVVAQPDQVARHGGVIQYDYGKTVQHRSTLQDIGFLNQPPYILLSALSKARSAPQSSSKFGQYLDSLKYNPDDPDFRDRPRHDRLFEASYMHHDDGSSCDSCSAEHEIKRHPRQHAQPVLHYGTIGSGDQVMKSALMRDTLSKKHNGILCFEMEAAGLMNQFPCLVIRGISDYCDSHKNKEWQPFAAAAAAAWAKELLRNVAADEHPVSGTLSAPLTAQHDLVQEKIEETEHSPLTYSKSRREQVKAFLGPSSDPQDTFERINKQRAPGTGEWIHYDLNFTEWLSRAFPVLSVSGTAGAGKTFLSSSMVAHLRQHFSHSQPQSITQPSVGYYFFKDNDPGTRGFCQALRDIAYQICQSNTAYEMHVEDLSNSQVDVSTLGSAWNRLFRDFWIREPACSPEVQKAAYLILDGIDEAFQKELKEFLDCLQDLEFDAAGKSRLQIALVGRTHLTDDISDAVPLGQFHDIRVDPEKTAADIRTYVSGSMRKSRLLRKVSKKLQGEVMTILSTQSNGMFLWVDLMLRELNTRRSEREVSEALHKAPKGIFAILTHVLEGLSESLQKEDAEDFNNLLQWVASVPAPVTLRVLDAMLKYKSPTGDSVVLLESRLRRQYASFFNLLRIDGLTTAELQSSGKAGFDFDLNGDDSGDGDDHDWQKAQTPALEEEIAMDDLEADFDSDFGSTYVVLTHASIGEFFKEGEGAVVCATNGCHVGIELESARFQILKTIFEVLTDNSIDDSFPDPQDEGAAEKARSLLALKEYARSGLLDHIVTVDPSKASTEEKKELAPLIVKFLRTKEAFEDWVEVRKVITSLWTGKAMPMLREWVDDADAQDSLSDEDRGWVESTAGKPFAMLSPIALFHAERWLQENFSDPSVDFHFIRKYRQMLDKTSESLGLDSQKKDPKKGGSKENTEKIKEDVGGKDIGSVDEKVHGVADDDHEEEKVTVKNILDQAEWAGFEKTAMWNLRVAKVIRDAGFAADSQKYFEKAIELDPNILEVRGALARAYMVQGRHAKSLELLEESVCQYKAKLARAQAAELKLTAHWLVLDLISLGTCYEALDRVEEASNAFKEAWQTNPEISASAINYIRLNDGLGKTKECIDFLREMDHRKSEEGDCSCLIRMMATQGISVLGRFLMGVWQICLLADEITFVNAVTRRAIAYSIKCKALDHAIMLQLLLGCTYGCLPETEERSVQILEQYVDKKSSADPHPTIAMFFGVAMSALAYIHFNRAWRADGTPSCRMHLKKLENVAAANDAEIPSKRSRTPSLLLGSWLRSHGQPGDAMALFRPYVALTLAKIDSDTPAKTMSELLELANMLVLTGDDASPTAITRTLLRAEGVTREQIAGEFPECSGMCSRQSDIWCERTMFRCKDCHSTHFCQSCFDKLQSGTAGRMITMSCDRQHHWLRIDVHTETVPEGKMLVGASNDVVDFDKWKRDLKRAWNIK